MGGQRDEANERIKRKKKRSKEGKQVNGLAPHIEHPGKGLVSSSFFCDRAVDGRPKGPEAGQGKKGESII